MTMNNFDAAIAATKADDSTAHDQLPKEFYEFIEKLKNLPQVNLTEAYREATDYLDNNFAYFLTHVLNIGRPRWTAAIPTAAVAIPEDAKNIDEDFIFIFNPRFVDLFQLEEYRGTEIDKDEAMAFILAHETMHVLLNHLKLCKSNRFPDKQRFNIAADCVINDYLQTMGLKGLPGLCYGETLVGYNCSNATVSDVYTDLPDSCANCQGTGEVDEKGGEGGDQEGDGHSSNGKKPCPHCQGSGQQGQVGGRGGYPGKQIDDHNWMHDSTQKQQNKADKAGEKNPNMPSELERTKQDDDYQSNLNPGIGVGGAQAFSELHDVGLKWAELMKKINPFVFKRGPKPQASWHNRPRKLAAMPEGYVNLPIKKRSKNDSITGKKPAVVMALDTSGSIGQEQANQFVNMARSIPQDKIKLHVCTFTTQYEKLDLDNPSWSSGGTDFDPISEFIEREVMPVNKKRYPTAVIVVTDGYATFAVKRPNEKQAKGWYWLLTGNGIPNYGDALPGEVGHLIDYQRGVH